MTSSSGTYTSTLNSPAAYSPHPGERNIHLKQVFTHTHPFTDTDTFTSTFHTCTHTHTYSHVYTHTHTQRHSPHLKNTPNSLLPQASVKPMTLRAGCPQEEYSFPSQWASPKAGTGESRASISQKLKTHQQKSLVRSNKCSSKTQFTEMLCEKCNSAVQGVWETAHHIIPF